MGGDSGGDGGANPAGLDYKAMATGGIVRSPTFALIGEAGPEAVVPLNKASGLGMNITVNAGLVSTPDQVGQDIIAAIQKAQRRSGTVFAPA
jgi:SLT domain-containing protein